MKAEVINVGDGACSIYTGEREVMVTDCGSGPSGNGRWSAFQLYGALAKQTPKLKTIAVTHFDRDHWHGLAAYPTLVTSLAHIALPKKVVFHTPRFPRAAQTVPVVHLALEAAFTASAGPLSAALDLFGQWRRAGVHVSHRPVARGDTFNGADETWTCHWPPRDLTPFPTRTRNVLTDLNEELEGLAAQVPEVKEAIDVVYGTGWFPDQADDSAEPVTSKLTGNQLIGAINQSNPTLDVSKLMAKLRRYNNAMSLVHDVRDRLVNFGDCEGVGLSSLLRLQAPSANTLRLAHDYTVLLAPHHGTVEPATRDRPLFPSANTVAAQNGARHLGNQKTTFLRSVLRPGSTGGVDNTHTTSPLHYTV